MKLNRTGSNWTELERNKINENWRIIEGNYNDVVDKVSEEAFDKVVNSAKLNWKEPVDKYADLPSEASDGDTRMVRDSGKVYRFNGEVWQEIQQIDAGPVNELDDRLTSQLAQYEKHSFYNSTISHKEPKFMVTIVDDDGNRGFYTKYFELAKEYNIPITSAMITGRPMGFPWDDRPYNDRYYHYDEIIEMRDSGLIEFVSHTHNHNINYQPRDMTEEELFDDFKTSQEIMKRLGLNHRGVVQPFGSYNDKVLNVTRQVFEYSIGRGATGSNVISPPVDNYDISRMSIERNSFDEIKPVIDEAKEKNGWLVFVSHVDQDMGWSEERTRQVIEYVLSQGGKFVTTQEGINHHGNILQVGGTSISADGQVFGNNLGRVVVDKSTSITSSTPIHYFKPEAITYSIIRSSQMGGFPTPPDSSSGFLETHRLSENEDIWSYQIFTTTKEKEIYIRYWIEDENRWGGWSNIITSHKLAKLNEYDGETPISDFRTGVTVSRIQSSHNSAGLPRSTSGTLITYKPGDNAWNFQEFVEYNSTNKYIRHVNTDGSWSAWRRFVTEPV